MAQQDYLFAKAARLRDLNPVASNAELSNRELDRRMRLPVDRAAGAAGAVVPGVGGLGGAWNAERKFRITRNARMDEAREIQRREQRQRIAGVGAGLGLGVAGAGVGGLSKVPRPKRWKSPRKVAAGAGLLGASGAVSHRESRAKSRLEDRVWQRMLRDRPEATS